MAVSLVSTGVQFPDSTIQTTAIAAGGASTMVIYTASTTFTIPSGKTVLKVTVVGGGGGGAGPGSSGAAGASGVVMIEY